MPVRHRPARLRGGRRWRRLAVSSHDRARQRRSRRRRWAGPRMTGRPGLRRRRQASVRQRCGDHLGVIYGLAAASRRRPPAGVRILADLAEALLFGGETGRQLAVVGVDAVLHGPHDTGGQQGCQDQRDRDRAHQGPSAGLGPARPQEAPLSSLTCGGTVCVAASRCRCRPLMSWLRGRPARSQSRASTRSSVRCNRAEPISLMVCRLGPRRRRGRPRPSQRTVAWPPVRPVPLGAATG